MKTKKNSGLPTLAHFIQWKIEQLLGPKYTFLLSAYDGLKSTYKIVETVTADKIIRDEFVEDKIVLLRLLQSRKSYSYGEIVSILGSGRTLRGISLDKFVKIKGLENVIVVPMMAHAGMQGMTIDKNTIIININGDLASVFEALVHEINHVLTGKIQFSSRFIAGLVQKDATTLKLYVLEKYAPCVKYFARVFGGMFGGSLVVLMPNMKMSRKFIMIICQRV